MHLFCGTVEGESGLIKFEKLEARSSWKESWMLLCRHPADEWVGEWSWMAHGRRVASLVMHGSCGFIPFF